VTDQVPDHAAFDELAAGHAVHALEPADEQRFVRHAEQCLQCRQSIAEFRRVAGALAETAPPAKPSDRLGERILAAALADLGQQDPPARRRPDTIRPDTGGHDPATTAPGHEGTARPGHEGTATPGNTGTATPGNTGTATPGNTGTAVPGDEARSAVTPLRHPPGRGRAGRRWQKPAAIAAAAALIAGGGTWAGLAATATGPAPPVAACAPHACHQVTLIAQGTHRAAATVTIRNGLVWMRPAKMPANRAGEIYVLWQITDDNRPLAVGSFDVRPSAQGPIKIGALAASYGGTLAFAVSIEHGRTIPPAPSHVLALGQVS
jgi:anti-sigma-K factor RskA